MSWLSLNWTKSDKPEARRQMVENAVADGSDQAAKVLLAALGDRDAGVKLTAIEGLGKIKCKEAVPQLGSLLKDTDAETRKAVVSALGKIADPACKAFLADALGDAHLEVRRIAARSLELLRWVPATPQQRARWRVAKGDYAAAVADKEAALEPLLMELADDQCRNRRGVVLAIAKLQDARAGNALTGVLADPNPLVRAAAADALGDLGHEGAFEPLMGLLSDGEAQTRVAAVRALGKLKNPAAIEKLVHLLQDKSQEVKKAAIVALGQIGEPSSVRHLLPLMKDPALEVRQSAIEALMRIGAPESIETLIEALVDASKGIRQAALEALEKINPGWESAEAALRAMAVLQTAMSSRDYWIRYAAADILNRIIHRQPPEAIPAEITALLANHNAAVAALLESLEDRDSEIRQAAAEALGRMADSRTIGPLTSRLNDEDPWVRRSVRRALETLGSGSETLAPRGHPSTGAPMKSPSQPKLPLKLS